MIRSCILIRAYINAHYPLLDFFYTGCKKVNVEFQLLKKKNRKINFENICSENWVINSRIFHFHWFQK